METQTIAIKTNEDFCDFLAILSERKLFGEVTIYLQGGNVESCRVSERFSKSEFKAQVEARKKRPKVLIARSKDRTNATG